MNLLQFEKTLAKRYSFDSTKSKCVWKCLFCIHNFCWLHYFGVPFFSSSHSVPEVAQHAWSSSKVRGDTFLSRWIKTNKVPYHNLPSILPRSMMLGKDCLSFVAVVRANLKPGIPVWDFFYCNFGKYLFYKAEILDGFEKLYQSISGYWLLHQYILPWASVGKNSGSVHQTWILHSVL